MVPGRRVFVPGLASLGVPRLWAQAPPFPNRPIRIVPFGTAGGPIDVLARVYGEKLQQRWGQSVSFDPDAPPVRFSAGNFLME